MKLTTQQKLDAVLECLNEANENMHKEEFITDSDGSKKRAVFSSHDLNRKDLKTSIEIMSLLSDKGVKIPNNELNLMLFHLAYEEEYILEDVKYYNNTKDNVPSFRILYAGKLFLESGGYKEKLKATKRSKYFQILMICFASIGAFGLLILELIKIFSSLRACCSCHH